MSNVIWLRTKFNALYFFNKPLIYFDNASTTQKPWFLLNIFKYLNYNICSNPGRGQYYVGILSSKILNESRNYLKHIYLKCTNYECITYKSVTEIINAVYNNYWFMRKKVTILTCVDSHHSVIAPIYGKLDIFTLNVIGLDHDFIPNVRQYLNYIKNNVSLLIFNHMSNVIGILIPIRLYSYIKKDNMIFVVDGAQSAPHFDINIKSINCNAYLLSAHKLYSFSNMGICFGKKNFFNDLNPLILGGGGVHKITLNPFNCFLNSIPDKHESGSPTSFGLTCLSEILQWEKKINLDHEKYICRYLWYKLCSIKGINLIGNWQPSSRLISFTIDNVPSYEINKSLNKFMICIRSGYHCATPLIEYLGRSAVCRISIGLYNTYKDADMLIYVIKMLNINKQKILLC
ncbi:Cysteine desulfurase [Candidatus Hodgkinia cicadicola]|uniref:Cysteine desulfurase n=1 Tax=Candidatus Hodgkinia cicadicola TaxID=573658 RepID=A0ABX4MF26_9HYPH|nr:Cysteine desulfurase [Candidatus Hodgkinia cicadicola]PIM96860.1 Cysteine desulfurase [Candidatus Hodgkinia cicadicola]